MRIDGKSLAKDILQTLHSEVLKLKEQGTTPHLAVILVGDDPASVAYVRQKQLKGEAIGCKVSIYNFNNEISERVLLEKITKLNNDESTHGIIIQQPLPDSISPKILVDQTDPAKDVDGFCDNSAFTPPIAEAAVTILEWVAKDSGNNDFRKWLLSKNIVVLGKGETGGKPIAEKLTKLNAAPTVIDSKTENPTELTKNADIIISCVGKKDVLKSENIKSGTILLSIGMFRGEDGKLHGDYEEDDIKDKASYYTPVPGGVGPVNVAMLLKNVLSAAHSK